ncbi:MAG: T9SS type A sorting domain-containing protein, partial [Bacteroidota bacterium]|nr:T9SS type A sorting domain-containing protein [Bacteroidota bacterium]
SGLYSVTQTTGTFACPDTVNIYFSPEIVLSLPDTLSSCEAEIFTLNAGSLPYDYEWNTGAIIPEIQVQTSGLYSVTATNQDGCEASDTTLVSIIDVVMSISDTLVCEGSEVIVSTNSTQYTYQWSNGMTDALIFVYPEQPTNYFIFVSDAFNTCDYMIDVDVINVETGPIFGNNLVWSDSTEFYHVNANPGSTYDWYISGGTYNTDTLANIEIHWGPGIQGFISIVETSAEGCIGEAVEMDIVIQHPISIEQIISSDDFIIVPNPMRQSTHITIPGPYKNGLIQLFDITGKLLFEDELSGEVFYNLSQPHLAKGIYWIRLTGEESISKKLMVE